MFTQFGGTNDWNIYVRVLSAQFDRDHVVTEQDLDIAMKEMDKFDFVAVLDMPGSAALWETRYNTKMEHALGTPASLYSETYSAERERNKKFDDEFKGFEREFERLNRFDLH